MKRVIAISLLLVAFVCSLHSYDLYQYDLVVSSCFITETYTGGFEYTLMLRDKNGFCPFIFTIENSPVRMYWTLLAPTEIPKGNTFILDSPSNAFESCSLSVSSKSTVDRWLFINLDNPYPLINFLKSFLRDGYIEYSLSSRLYSLSEDFQAELETEYFDLSFARSEERDKARLEALEQLKRYEKYLY